MRNPAFMLKALRQEGDNLQNIQNEMATHLDLFRTVAFSATSAF